MKKVFLLVPVLFFMCLSNISTLYAFSGDDDDDPEEIDLTTQQQSGNEGPTSLNQISVNAYKTSSSVFIDLSNYSGNVVVLIAGMGGSIYSDQNLIIGAGRVLVDISSLPSGHYFVMVQANQVYQGSFMK